MEQSNTTISADNILQALIEGTEIHLKQCRISGSLDLNLLISNSSLLNTEHLQEVITESSSIYIFSQPVRFNFCVFENDLIFSGPWESSASIQVVFKNDVLFNSSEFLGQVRFSHARFEKLAGFDGCTFNRVCTFRNAVFEGHAMFRTATFGGYGLFNSAIFQGDTRFANTCFGKGANFTDVIFENRCDFGGVHTQNKSVPNFENVSFKRKRFGDDASFWRFIKQVCQEAGYYQQAGECFYRERCAYFWHRFRGLNYEKLTLPLKILRWLSGLRFLPELLLGRFLFGYGERPVRVLGASAVIIVSCGFFYSSKAAHLAFQYGLGDVHPSGHLKFLEGLYYSTVTFTTLGYGDIYPDADILTRMVTMFEALAGACLMALFVVSLAKRFSRG